MKKFDAIVIGAGPAGICAALYLVRAGLKTALIEKNTDGGQVLSTADVENYLGFPKGVQGWELADAFSAHLAEYPVEKIRGDVQSITTSQEGPYPIHTVHMDEDELTAPAIIIATGAKNRPLGIEKEDTYRGKGVSYCALCDGNFYRGLDVAVVGGGNSALEEALYLSRIVNKVYVIHRRDGFRAAQVYLDKIKEMPEKIELLPHYVVDDLAGEPNLNSVRIRNVQDDSTRDVAIEGLFVYIGMLPNASFIPSELAIDDRGFIITDLEMATEIPGIYAAGDIRSKACRQICTAVGDGATAATAAISYVELLNA